MKDGLSALTDMEYSGRGIIIGMTPIGHEFVGYSLTGRSSGSQARKLVPGDDTGVIRTDVTTKKVLEDETFNPALLLYPAIIPVHNKAIIVGNGIQTELVYDLLHEFPSIDNIVDIGVDPEPFLRKVLSTSVWRYDLKKDLWIDITSYEPDSPIYTPRITALVIGDKAAIHIVRRTESGAKESKFYPIRLVNGEGKLITTYKGGNEEPFPLSFVGEPLDVTIESNYVSTLVQETYDAIQGGSKPEDNFRVAVAVMLRNHHTDEMEHKTSNRIDVGS